MAFSRKLIQVALLPVGLGGKPLLRKVDKAVYLTGKVLTNIEKLIILNNGNSFCYEEVENSETPFRGVAQLAQSLISPSCAGKCRVLGPAGPQV